ncbi:hypothetical protein O181_037982 [Austropuccinia psidii MF-1]|uniref:Uncharacterized protein n=1 Tax=Austropuccinia psidii MF-1 TaxID=1389203 RepID=A0A9Q3HBG4_9BASI|nr:hypothetical protein [Austropuccinia psidii MF-1]
MPTLTLELASTFPPNPLHPTPLQMRLQHFPPISTLTTPYSSTPPLLTIFMLLKCSQDETTMPASPLLTLPHPRLIFSSAYNPYAPAGPSSYASDTALNPAYHP